MEVSIFLAKVMGIYMIIICLSLLVNQKYYQGMVKDFSKNPLLMVFGGFISLIIGLLIVLSHNVWSGWQIIITIIGWLAIVKGILYLLLPDFANDLAKKFNVENIFNLTAFSNIVLGAVLLYAGFIL